MMERRIEVTPRRRLVVASATMVALAITVATAFAGHVGGDVKSYTGCLTVSGGTLSLVKEGDAPQKPCPSGSVQAHFSGGDITRISQGTGIQVTHGESGEATIAVDPKYSLRQDCSFGKILRWDGTGWACSDDHDTTYSADGTTLTLSGSNVFSIASNYRVKNTPDCSSGQFATGFDSNGNIQCAAPAAGTVQAFFASGRSDLAGTETVVSKTLPAGKYLLFATFRFDNRDLSSDSTGRCDLDPDVLSTTGVVHLSDIPEPGDTEIIALSGTITTTGETVELTCTELEADVSVEQANLIALKVDSLG